jgi:hypothetical protein
MAILQAQGVSMFSVYDALLVAPSRIFLEHRTWFRVPPSMKLTAPWALLGLGSAAFSAWKQPLTDTPAWRVLFAGKTVFCAVALAVIVSGRPVLPVVIPFAWLLLFNPNQADDESQSFPRSLLSILTVLQSLYAYPVAGNQAQFIQILLWITLIVCVGDSLSWLAGAWRPSGVPVRWVRIAATAALVAVALLQVREGVQRFRKYRSLPSLDLPGARLVHVSPGIKADQRWLVGSLQRQCDSFESYPGLRSLNFWTGIEPLTGLSIDNWAQSFSPDQEQRVAAALSGHPQACVVYNPRLAEFWNPGKENLDNHPLVGYIFRNFQPVSGSGDYQLMLRSERVGKAALPSR